MRAHEHTLTYVDVIRYSVTAHQPLTYLFGFTGFPPSLLCFIAKNPPIDAGEREKCIPVSTILKVSFPYINVYI